MVTQWPKVEKAVQGAPLSPTDSCSLPRLHFFFFSIIPRMSTREGLILLTLLQKAFLSSTKTKWHVCFQSLTGPFCIENMTVPFLSIYSFFCQKPMTACSSIHHSPHCCIDFISVRHLLVGKWHEALSSINFIIW